MGFLTVERLSDSPYIEAVMHGQTIADGSTIRPAEIHWHMVLAKHQGGVQAIMVGPLTTAGVVTFTQGVELLWIKFKLGTFMPHLPVRSLLDMETILPSTAKQSFWLKGSSWQFPDYENADTFVDWLVRDEVLAFDPIVNAVLRDQPQDVASRTVRHRFLQATGLTRNHVFQVERAQRAAKLLGQGFSILDTVEEAGYFDQPHLTRSLKQWVGYTPAQIIRMTQSACHSIFEGDPEPAYETAIANSALP